MTWSFHWVRWQEEVPAEDGTSKRVWVGSLVEKDIAAQGDDLDDLDYNLKHLLAGRVVVHKELGLPGDPFDDVPPPSEDILKCASSEAIRFEMDGPHIVFHDGSYFTES